jgi:hypothetical protein
MRYVRMISAMAVVLAIASTAVAHARSDELENGA